jgi:hypothetical protein
MTSEAKILKRWFTVICKVIIFAIQMGTTEYLQFG